jgi:hypothetical protein
MNLEPIKGPPPAKPPPAEENPFAEDGDKTVAGVPPLVGKRKTKSQPTLSPEPEPQTDPTTVGKAKKGNDTILYVVLAVLALLLVAGAIILFKSDSPEETKPIDSETSGPPQKRRK